MLTFDNLHKLENISGFYSSHASIANNGSVVKDVYFLKECITIKNGILLQLQKNGGQIRYYFCTFLLKRIS